MVDTITNHVAEITYSGLKSPCNQGILNLLQRGLGEKLMTKFGIKRRLAQTRIAVMSVGLVAFVAIGLPAFAQSYPTRTVSIVVPYGPGGATSNFGQMLADNLSKKWGQPVIVENRPGAGSSIGAAIVANAEPDGYTILLAGDSALVSNELIFKDIGFDPKEDLTAVSQLANVNYALLVSSRTGITDFDGFVKTMRASGEDYNYGSVGGGDASRLGMEKLKQQAELGEIVEIPYTGMANTLQGMLSGDHDMMMVSVRTGASAIESGGAVPVVISGEKRAAALPEVPTYSEVGLTDISVGFFLGAMVPSGTDPAIVQEISAALQSVLEQPEVKKTYEENLGFELVESSPEEFQSFLDEERKRVGALVKSLNIEPQ